MSNKYADRSTPLVQEIATNPAGWPEAVLPMFERALTCEVATLTRIGAPITYPLTPYVGDDERTLDVSTGLTYPAKAERARRNPKVGMLFSDAVGSGLRDAPVVLVYGLASVRDADLQANTDRYVRLSLAKVPAGFKGTPGFMLKGMAWYFARMWIEVTPTQILWWPEGWTDDPPQRWDAPEGMTARPSDPAAAGKLPGAWAAAPTEWWESAKHAVEHLGLPVLTVVDASEFPFPMRVKGVSLTTDGFRLEVPSGMPVQAEGKACLTFHTHAEVFSGQENKVFVGEVNTVEDGVDFRVERSLADWSLNGSRLSTAWAFLGKRWSLAPRLKAEAARRGQAVPRVNLPGNR